MSKETKICECCGKSFPIKIDKLRYDIALKQKFCSRACTLSETKVTNQKTIDSHKAVVREFREHLGFEASDTESTWRTEDIYKVKSLDTRYHKAMRSVARKYDVAKNNSSFFSAFKALFPKEWEKGDGGACFSDSACCSWRTQHGPNMDGGARGRWS